MSDPPRRQRERSGGHRDTREQRAPRDPDRHRAPRDPNRHRAPSSDRSSSQPPYYSRDSSSHHSRQNHARRGASEEEHDSKCSHICSRRGIVLICATLTNILVLFCIVAAHVTLSGMSAMNFGSGSFVDTIIPFEGVELQQVRDLDMQFGQMRAPGVYGGVAFSLTFGVLSLLFVVSGNKPAHLLAWKLLIGQFAFQVIGAVVYVIAVGLYLHFVIKVNSTDVCLKRERLYARNGYTWMNCNVGGADAAVALFGIITVILYAVGSVLTGKTIQGVSQYHKDRARYEAERQSQPKRAQSTPLQSDIYV